MKQNRWKSKVLWMAVSAQVIILLQLFGAFKSTGVSEGTVIKAIEIFLTMLVSFGILNNPTDKENF